MDCDVRATNQISRALETHPLHAQRAEGGDGGAGRPPDHAQHVRERAEEQHARERAEEQHVRERAEQNTRVST